MGIAIGVNDRYKNVAIYNHVTTLVLRYIYAPTTSLVQL
jgi:hypothetical protein